MWRVDLVLGRAHRIDLDRRVGIACVIGVGGGRGRGRACCGQRRRWGSPIPWGLNLSSGRENGGISGRRVHMASIEDGGKTWFGAVMRAHRASDELMRTRLERDSQPPSGRRTSRRRAAGPRPVRVGRGFIYVGSGAAGVVHRSAQVCTSNCIGGCTGSKVVARGKGSGSESRHVAPLMAFAGELELAAEKGSGPHYGFD